VNDRENKEPEVANCDPKGNRWPLASPLERSVTAPPLSYRLREHIASPSAGASLRTPQEGRPSPKPRWVEFGMRFLSNQE